MKKVIKFLESKGFRVEYGNGSRAKIYPPDPQKPFYSAHLSNQGIHPIRRFAKKEWGIEIKF